jgi:arylsulfate sulfotransferase
MVKIEMRRAAVFFCGFAAVLTAGCGGGGPHPAATPVFSPAAGTFTTIQTVAISSATPGAAIYYTTDGSAPTIRSTKYTAPISVMTPMETLSAIAVATGFSNSAVGTAQYTLNFPPPTLSVASYAFPQNQVGTALTETVATVTNPATVATTLSVAVTGDPSLTLVGAQSCGAQLAAGASCPVVVQYLPTEAGTQTGSVSIASSGDVTGTAAVALTGNAATPAGTVASTTNPLVALYTVTPGSSATVAVQFGPDTTYAYTTSAIATATGTASGPVSIEVGGMRANSTYHMRATITYADGTTATNADQTFTTGALPSDLAAVKLNVTTATGMTPQPGIELLDPVMLTEGDGPWQPYATDLQGNIIWYYPWADYPKSAAYLIDGIKQLSNGDFLAVIGTNNGLPFPNPDPSTVFIREFDLIGNTVRQLSLTQMNANLAAAGFGTQADGSPLTMDDFHHDVTPLPNGHWLVLGNTTRLETINGKQVTVQGDVVIDVDQNMQPVFVWNEFDHFDVTRQPMGFPDWTHSNAVVYTPDDGNFLVSIRHQNWVVKVNYQNGTGDGSVLWRLGYQGDFTLVDTVDPQGSAAVDWQYAQHAPSIVGSASAGVFDLTLMDNGNDRIVPGNINACPTGQTASCYSTIPVFQIDEAAKTVTVESRITLPTSLYNDFGGNAEVLANNDLEYDLAGTPTGAYIFEVQQNSSNTPVWSLATGGSYVYRGFRLPSLYSGVQWP